MTTKSGSVHNGRAEVNGDFLRTEMKTIDSDELYRNVTQFLERKGVELKEGSYARRLQQCCGLLADVVNTTHKTVTRACAEMDRKLKDIRETVRGGARKAPPVVPPEVGPTAATQAQAETRRRRRTPTKRARPVKAGSAQAKRKVVRKSPRKD
jgi:hypothetical protein